jgi:hypothetical protein
MTRKFSGRCRDLTLIAVDMVPEAGQPVAGTVPRGGRANGRFHGVARHAGRPEGTGR